MIRPTRFVLLALLCSSAASAADERIRTLRYDPNQIVSVAGRAGIQSTIEFGPDEHIESVAVGDSAAWQVTPNRRASLLFVKPLVASSKSNMTVVTDQRTYMFDLIAGRAAPLYALKFSYPDTPAKPKIEQASIVIVPPPPPPTPAQLNFGWKTKGAANLLPSRVFDDGTTLYLAWARGAQLPAVLTISDDGKEGALNYRVAGDYLVVTPVPGNIVLRYGKKSATAVRAAPEIAPVRVERPPVRQAEVQQAPTVVAVTVPVAASPAPPVRMAETLAPRVPSISASTPAPAPPGTIQKLAYPVLDSDHLADAHHE
ncbi:MAG: TrbG/VirB9 family P-type conjugative transfer protein [Sphingomicrobium sp.]